MTESRSGYSRGLDPVASEMQLKVAVIGAGYWGPNLARNFTASPDWELAGIVDLDQRQGRQARRRPGRRSRLQVH